MTENAKDRLSQSSTHASIKTLKRLWNTKRPDEQIANELQISLSTLHDLVRQHNLPARTHINFLRKQGEKEVDPTPEEIVARAAELRARWTDEDYARSAGYKPKPVDIRTYAFDGNITGFVEINRLPS